MKPVIFVVHTSPENALENTFKRFQHTGRGASIEIMAHIQGNLPEGLKRIQKKFGKKVDIKIFDFRDRTNPKQIGGWAHLPILESEGDYDTIKQRLTTALKEHFRNRTITENCFRQAVGQHPIEHDR
ncbi:MAG: hypothetical protein ACRCTY_00760 [Candidatus Adiutrix sp.]